jgi:hypothetical protein
MLTSLTVRDVLLHAARSRLPDSVSYAQKVERVEEVMAALGISHIQNSIIGDAESGQRGVCSFSPASSPFVAPLWVSLITARLWCGATTDQWR